MNRAKSHRTAAKVLHETLQVLEQSSDVDPRDPSFMKLKSSVLDHELELQEKATALETPFPEETTD